jgi:hypothetical protein
MQIRTSHTTHMPVTLHLASLRAHLPVLVLAPSMAVATWLLTGVSATEAARYFLFEAAYIILPGCLLYTMLSSARGGWLRTLAIGWPCGYALEIGGFALTAGLHVREAFAFLSPTLAVVMGAWLLYKRGRLRSRLGTVRRTPILAANALETRGKMSEAATVTAVVIVSLMLLALTNFSHYPLPGHARSVSYYADNVDDISLAADARHHWPITDPSVAGQPFHYYTGVFIHIAAVNQITGVALSTVILRLLPAMLVLIMALQLWCLGRSLGYSKFAGPLMIALFFVVEDLNLDPARPGAFGAELFAVLPLSPTYALGVVFFLGLLILIQPRFAAETLTPSSLRIGRPWLGSVPPGTAGSSALMAILVLGGSATKTAATGDLIGGLGLYWLWFLLKGRSSRAALHGLITSLVCILGVYLLMLRGGRVSVLRFRPLDFVRYTIMTEAYFVHSIVRPFLVVAAATISCLFTFAPILGAGWLLRKRRDVPPFMVLLYAIFIVSFLAYLMLSFPGDGEGYFLAYGYIAAVPLAAVGLIQLWRDLSADARRGMVMACSALVALGLVIGESTQAIVLTQRTWAIWYVVAYGVLGGIILLAGRGFVKYPAYAGLSRVANMTACFILFFAALGLVKPLAITGPDALGIVSGERHVPTDSPKTPGMTTVLYKGLLWVRNHTAPSEILAVNTHRLDPSEIDSRYFYYSAFTERRVFLESWIYTLGGAGSSQPFPERYRLNTLATTRGDPLALRRLAEDGVSVILIDKTHEGIGQPLSRVATLMFSNSALDVYRIARPAVTQ